jgi:multiple sugar transport system substrate-binding protein
MIKTCASAFALVAAVSLPSGVFAADQNLAAPNRIGLPSAPNTLSVRLNTSSPGNGDPAVAKGYQDLFVEFIKKHPDWQLQMQIETQDIGNEQAKMLEEAKAGNAPDCAAVDSFVLGQFKLNHVLSDLSPYFSKEEVADLFPFVREGVSDKDGKIYAWWWNTDLRVLYRRTDMVPTAPVTWDELKAAGVASTKKGMEGVVFNGGRYEGAIIDWLSNYWDLGGKLVDDSGKPVFGDETNKPIFLKAMGYYKDLVDSGAAPKRVTTIANYDDLNAAAAAASTALFIGGSWQLAQLKSMLEPDQFSQWAFSPLPGPTPDKHITATGGWTIASLSKDPKKVEMCAALIHDVYMGQGNALEQALPTRASLFNAYPIFATPANQAFAADLKSGQARPRAPIYPEISNQIQILMGDVLSGSKQPEEALDTAYQAALAAYKRL